MLFGGRRIGRRCWRIRFAVCTRCRWWWPANSWAPWTCFGLIPVCCTPAPSAPGSALRILLGVRTNLLFGSGRLRLVAMKKHSIEAQRLLDELDAELAANGAAAGRSLGWSASERQIISMAADAIDRGMELAAAYAEAVDVKNKIKVSREIRLQEMATTRLLSKVSTAVPAPESLRSIKARNAVNKRWHPNAG